MRDATTQAQVDAFYGRLSDESGEYEKNGILRHH